MSRNLYGRNRSRSTRPSRSSARHGKIGHRWENGTQLILLCLYASARPNEG